MKVWKDQYYFCIWFFGRIFMFRQLNMKKVGIDEPQFFCSFKVSKELVERGIK